MYLIMMMAIMMIDQVSLLFSRVISQIWISLQLSTSQSHLFVPSAGKTAM